MDSKSTLGVKPGEAPASPKLRCCFGVAASNPDWRCNNDATHISTFNGKDCAGKDGVLCWCNEHGPASRATKTPGHGFRDVTHEDVLKWGLISLLVSDGKRGVITHEVKAWPEFFQPVWDQVKLFEIRKNDRDYRVGDLLIIDEWSPITRVFTGRRIEAIILYVTNFEQKPGFVVMGMSVGRRGSRPS